MNTNVVNISDAAAGLAESVFVSVADGLQGASNAISENGWNIDILVALAAILASLLAIIGLWVVVRRLIRAFRSTR